MSQKYNGRIMCTRLEDLNPFPGEIFVDITEDVLPGIFPYYKISNYGRVYNKYTKSFIGNYNNTTRYVHLNLSAYPNSINIDLHRLMLMVFDPNPNASNLEVNHKDGNKTNNALSNLEWCTRSDNITHAYENGLKNRDQAVLSEDQVRYICELLQMNKYTQKEIAELANCNVHNVNDIKQGKWSYITKDYNFNYKKYRSFTDADAEKICEYFANNPRPNDKLKSDHCRDAIKYAGLDDSAYESVKKIYSHKQYKHISSKYSFE